MSSYRLFPKELVRRHQEIAMRPENILKTAKPTDVAPAVLFGEHERWSLGLSVNL